MMNQKRRNQTIFLIILFSLILLVGSAEASKFKLRVSVTTANIRLRPSLESVVISKAHRGAILNAEEKIGNWYKIKLPPDENGIIIAGYIHQSIVVVLEETKKEILREEKSIEVNQKKKDITYREIEQRDKSIKQKHQVTQKYKEKRFTFRSGIGLSFPSGDWADYFTLGIGINAGNGYKVIKYPNFDLEIFGSLGAHFFFAESYYSESNWTRLILSADGRFNLKAIEPITIFVQGGLGLYWDVLEIYGYFWYDKESNIKIGGRIGGGVAYKDISLIFMYHIENNKMFSLMITAGWNF
ncbi:MAG: hypothetical protein ACOC56_05715 [Atribacterota bacterium]